MSKKLKSKSQILRFRNSIAYQLLTVVFAVYFVISVGITAFHMVMEYKTARELIVRELSLLQTAFEDGLSTSLYELNREQLTSIVNGMYNVPILVGVNIEPSNTDIVTISMALGAIYSTDKGFVQVDQAGASTPAEGSGLIIHSFPIYAPRTTTQIARGTLYSSEEIVFLNVKDSFVRIIISAIIKTLALWILFLWAASGRLSGPLRAITAYIAKLSPTNPGYLSVVPTQAELKLKEYDNEIGILAQTVENLHSEILRKIKTMIELEEQIKRQNQHLIEEVEERKRAENVAMKATQAKSEFLANMSHDLRTPLNAILGFSEIMTENTFGPLGNPIYEEYAIDIRESGQLLVSLINDVLDLSKIEAGKYELVEENINIEPLIEGSFKMLRKQAADKNLHLVNASKPDLCLLRGDRRACTQIFNNLLSNAIKFTPANGNVTMSAGKNENNEIYIEVVDTGIGMSEDDIANAMVPFKQINSQHSRELVGTGLGLYLCKQLMDMHQGEVFIESAVEEGTTVTIRFPQERTVSASLEHI